MILNRGNLIDSYVALKLGLGSKKFTDGFDKDRYPTNNEVFRKLERIKDRQSTRDMRLTVAKIGAERNLDYDSSLKVCELVVEGLMSTTYWRDPYLQSLSFLKLEREASLLAEEELRKVILLEAI